MKILRKTSSEIANTLAKDHTKSKEEAILDIYEGVFELKGYEIKPFLDPIKGREYILTNDSIDVILTDIMMPNLDGITMIKELHSNPKTLNIPIIAVSGLNDEKTLKTVLSAGAADYVVKPFNIDVLSSKIEALCKGKKRSPNE